MYIIAKKLNILFVFTTFIIINLITSTSLIAEEYACGAFKGNMLSFNKNTNEYNKHKDDDVSSIREERSNILTINGNKMYLKVVGGKLDGWIYPYSISERYSNIIQAINENKNELSLTMYKSDNTLFLIEQIILYKDGDLGFFQDVTTCQEI